MIVIYNDWNMLFIFIWKLFVQNNIQVVKFLWMCLSGRIMAPLLSLHFFLQLQIYMYNFKPISITQYQDSSRPLYHFLENVKPSKFEIHYLHITQHSVLPHVPRLIQLI